MDYEYVEVYKDGNKNYVNFLNKNNEEVFYSEVYFDNEEIEEDPENCFFVKDTYCDYLNKMIEEDEDGSMEREIEEQYYELRTETYDLSYKLIIVLSILDLMKEGTKYYICGNKIFTDKECKKTLPIFEDLVEYIEEVVNDKYETTEEQIEKIQKGVEYIKFYFLSYLYGEEKSKELRKDSINRKYLEIITSHNGGVVSSRCIGNQFEYLNLIGMYL